MAIPLIQQVKVGGYIREIRQVRGADGRLRDAQQGDVFPKGTVLARIREKDFIERVHQANAQLAQELHGQVAVRGLGT